MFELKNEAELTAMTPEQRDAYAVAKQKHEAEEVAKRVSEEVAKAIEPLKKVIADNEIEIKALKETPKVEKNVPQLVKALNEKKEELSKLKEGIVKGVNFTLKAAGTITTSNVDAVGTNGLSMLLNDAEGGITVVPRSQPFFADLFASSGTNGSTVSYAEMVNNDGGAGMTGEGSAKTQADFDIVESKADVKKITSFIKASKEALDDIEQLRAEINGELMTLVKLKKDSQMLSGDGTGNNLNGVLTQAQTFTGGSLAGTIVAPNNYDVLVAGITEIITAEVITGEPAGFMANVIVLHPVDIAGMKLTKDANNNYVFPVHLPGAEKVLEVPVVSNARMTEGDFLIMDSTKGNLRIREDINIQVGYVNDDFTKNLITILAEMRLAFYIKSNHAKAFVKGTFSTAIGLLTQP